MERNCRVAQWRAARRWEIARCCGARCERLRQLLGLPSPLPFTVLFRHDSYPLYFSTATSGQESVFAGDGTPVGWWTLRAHEGGAVTGGPGLPQPGGDHSAPGTGRGARPGPPPHRGHGHLHGHEEGGAVRAALAGPGARRGPARRHALVSAAAQGRQAAAPADQPELARVLRQWRDNCPATDEGLVFPVRTRRGTYRMGSKEDMLGLAKLLRGARCHVPAKPWHALRHTFASHFMMSGGNILTLQKLLGHADLKMTMVYAHLSPDFVGAEVARMSFAAARPAEVASLDEHRRRATTP
jgi:hypothetical protein